MLHVANCYVGKRGSAILELDGLVLRRITAARQRIEQHIPSSLSFSVPGSPLHVQMHPSWSLRDGTHETVFFRTLRLRQHHLAMVNSGEVEELPY